MKKWFKIILPMFVFAFSLFMPGMKANAGTNATINAAAGTNQITVSGTADTGVLSVVVFVYDSTGTTLLKMESVAVDSNHAYTDTISAVPGTYVVKVADYEGGEFKEKTVTIQSTSTNPGDEGSGTSSNESSESSSSTSSGSNESSVEAPKEEKVVVAIEYTVVKGDTLSKIAKKNNLSLSAILAMNPQIKNANRIYPGQKIVVGHTTKTVTGQTTGNSKVTIPSTAVYYAVQKGDSLYRIARKNGISMTQLAALNPEVMRQKYIYTGQKIRVK